MTTTSSSSTRRFALGVAGLLIALAPGIAAVAGSSAGSASRVLACESTDTEDSFSMSCSPPVVPDVSDQLTEAEVAEPGWNAYPHDGAGGAPHASGGHGGHA